MTDTESKLVKLMEECAELSQIASKILRFGLHSRHPTSLARNDHAITWEVAGVLAAIDELADINIIARPTQDEINDARDRGRRYAEMSRGLGRIADGEL